MMPAVNCGIVYILMQSLTEINNISWAEFIVVGGVSYVYVRRKAMLLISITYNAVVDLTWLGVPHSTCCTEL